MALQPSAIPTESGGALPQEVLLGLLGQAAVVRSVPPEVGDEKESAETVLWMAVW